MKIKRENRERREKKRGDETRKKLFETIALHGVKGRSE